MPTQSKYLKTMQKTGNLSLNLSPQYSASGDRSGGNTKNNKILWDKTKNAPAVTDDISENDAIVSRLMDSTVGDVVNIYSENSKIELESSPTVMTPNVVGKNNNNDGYYINNNDLDRIDNGNITEDNSCPGIEMMSEDFNEAMTGFESDPSRRHVGIKLPKSTKLSRLGNKTVGLKRQVTNIW